MGRRTYESKSREQNTREIVRGRDRFLGELSDIPGNEVDKNHQVQVVDQLCYDIYARSRGGILPVGSVPLPGVQDTTGATFSQSGTTVSSTGSGSYGFATADVGRLICFYGLGLAFPVVKITARLSSSTVTVSNAQNVTAQAAVVRDPLHSYDYCEKSGYWVAHAGTKIYYAPEALTTAWASLQLMGTVSATITDADSHIGFINGDPYVFCAGIWRIDLDQQIYYKVNVDPNANGMTVDRKSVV